MKKMTDTAETKISATVDNCLVISIVGYIGWQMADILEKIILDRLCFLRKNVVTLSP